MIEFDMREAYESALSDLEIKKCKCPNNDKTCYYIDGKEMVGRNPQIFRTRLEAQHYKRKMAKYLALQEYKDDKKFYDEHPELWE